MLKEIRAWGRARAGGILRRRPGSGASTGAAGDERLWARRKTKVFFDNQDLDVYLAFTLARAASRGASLGESIVAASRVAPRDPRTWARAWTDVAVNAERHAERLVGVDPVGAQDGFLRAASYYRTAIFGQGVDEALASHTATVRTFRRFAEHVTQARVEPLEVAWDGWRSPGYAVLAGQPGQPRPTILLFLGGETLAEDAWVWIAEAAARRGWNTLVAEPPSFFGFRAGNPSYPAVTWATIEPFVRPYVDAAVARDDVDPDRLVAAGFSGGGFLAVRAAGMDSRIRALVADAPIVDFDRLASAEFPKALLSAPKAMVNAVVAAAARRDPFLALTLDKFRWQFGVEDVTGFFAAFRGTTNADILANLAIPVLALTGEGESQEQQRQAQEAYAMLPGPKEIRVFTTAEGAEAHTQVNHPALMQEAVFAWLARTLPAGDPTPAPAPSAPTSS